MNKFKSKYGDELILGLAEDDTFEIKCIPTNLIGVDYVIGRPGIPAHKITQICGFEDSGKSLLGINFLISFQKRYENGIPVLIDTEYSFDPDFFESLGGDPNKIVVFTPKTLEEVFKFLEDLVKEVRNEYGNESHILALIDSLSIAVSAEIESGAYQPGLHARLLSHIFRKIRNQLPKWNATLIYISQNKEKISMGPWGGGTSRLGGHAVDFAPVLSLEMKKIGIKSNSKGEPEYVEFKIKATKNHIAIPFKEFELIFDLKTYRFRNGYNIVKLLTSLGKIKKKKGWYEYEDNKYREKDLYELFENEEWDNKIRKELGLDYESYNIL